MWRNFLVYSTWCPWSPINPILKTPVLQLSFIRANEHFVLHFLFKCPTNASTLQYFWFGCQVPNVAPGRMAWHLAILLGGAAGNFQPIERIRLSTPLIPSTLAALCARMCNSWVQDFCSPLAPTKIDNRNTHKSYGVCPVILLRILARYEPK